MNGSGPGLFEAFIESWRLVIGNAATLARTALIPFLIFIALERLQWAFRPEGEADLAWRLLFVILAAPPAVMLLMPWYRQLLAAADPGLAARPATWWSMVLMLRWLGLDIMFLAVLAPALVITAQVIAAGAEAAPPGQIILIHYALVFLGSYLVYGRMGLSLPSAAAEADHGYRHSWAMTGDNGWRIGLAIVLCATSVEFPISILRAPLATENATMAMQYLHAVMGAVSRVTNELLSTAVFAQFYLHLRNNKTEGEE